MSKTDGNRQRRRFMILQTGTLPDNPGGMRGLYGDMAELFFPPLGFPPEQVVVTRLHEHRLPAGEPGDYSGILITGSPLMVSAQEDWMLRIRPWLERARAEGVPLLGVCFGHQLLACAFGGHVGASPGGLEAGTVSAEFSAERAEDPLFSVLPASAPVQVHHYESVIVPPAGAEIVGWSAHDEHHALRYGPACWGVQFHPELTAPMMRTLLQEEVASLQAAELDPLSVLDRVRNTPVGPTLLRRFREIAERRHAE
ncbi:glutamine amidotransferase [Kineobactrum salinum]|uniref:Glutamine amidotransferase n=1 Tax=Kineobactrum salinum TaxID=2708301 RepID=A0A6C0U3C1_9GAMM|nr:glutamine amidotransferase [Kineobactrum salinum]QIB66343.1 glutamine amidotransferase [Kineobactrum salinum]